MPLVTSTTKIDWSNADRDYKRGQNLIRQGDWANGFKLHELRALPDAFWNPAAKFEMRALATATATTPVTFADFVVFQDILNHKANY